MKNYYPTIKTNEMKKMKFLNIIGLLFLLVTQFNSNTFAQEKSNASPNILLLLADDLGWMDLSCYGSTFYETPNIDKLAEQGMKFSDAYAAANVCSPTRAALLTGKTPARLHITDFLSGLEFPYVTLTPPNWQRLHLPLEEVTTAEVLKSAGYETYYFGKWHLGGEDHFPVTQGFDHSTAESKSGWPGDYFYPWPTVQNMKGKKGDYLTDRLTDEVIKSLQSTHKKPFFMQVSFYAPHRPTQAKKELVEKYEEKLTEEDIQRNPIHAGMLETLDTNIGRIITVLEELNITENTIVIFASDNGGTHYADIPQKTNNAPLRDGKGAAYEGAYRVPMIVKWPNKVPEGVVTAEPVSSIDLFPTFQALSGQEVTTQGIDGVNLLPLLLDQKSLGREALYWHYPHYHNGGSSPHGVVRKGDYRLIEYYDGRPGELFNLKKDISETVNLYQSMPEKSKELLKDLKAWRKEVGAQMPTLNPNYDPDRIHEYEFYIPDSEE